MLMDEFSRGRRYGMFVWKKNKSIKFRYFKVEKKNKIKKNRYPKF